MSLFQNFICLNESDCSKQITKECPRDYFSQTILNISRGPNKSKTAGVLNISLSPHSFKMEVSCCTQLFRRSLLSIKRKKNQKIKKSKNQTNKQKTCSELG